MRFLKPLLCIATIALVCHQSYAQTEILKKTLHFEVGSAVMSDEVKAIMGDLVDSLTLFDKYTIVIRDNLDTRGADQQQRQTALDRTVNLRRSFLMAGINPASIITDPYGETVQNSVTQNGMKNQIVEIEIKFARKEFSNLPGGKKEALAARKKKCYANKLFDYIKQPSQEFCLHSLRDTLLVGQNGTLVYIPEGAFQISASAIKTKCLHVLLREDVSPADAIVDNLNSLTSDNQLLRVNRAVSLSVVVDNKPVKLKKNKQIIIASAPDMDSTSTTVFYGSRSRVDTAMLWNKINGVKVSAFSSQMLHTCFSSYAAAIQEWNGLSKRKQKERYEVPSVCDTLSAANLFNKGFGAYLDRIEQDEVLRLDSMFNVGAEVKTHRLFWAVSGWGWYNATSTVNTDSVSATQIYVGVKPQDNADVRLISSTGSFVMPYSFSDSWFVFNHVPDGDYWIVAMKLDKDQFSVGIKKATIGKAEGEGIELEAATKEEFIQKITAIKY